MRKRLPPKNKILKEGQLGYKKKKTLKKKKTN
jgi:hypothetical protein